MSEHFVKYINIKRYKCFSDFSTEGFKRVNLISGKNNVGKTALMEALFVNVASDNAGEVIHSLNFVDFRRNQADQAQKIGNVLNNMRSISKAVKLATNISAVSYRFDDSEVLGQYEISVHDKALRISEESIKEIIKNPARSEFPACYISSFRDSQKDIIYSFTAIQKRDRESQVDEIIQHFDNSIENIKVIGGDSIQCKVIDANGSTSYRNISEFGDGLRHYIAIIADLFKAEDRYLFIDELDNGIHYSSMDQLWEIILTLSKELNVQVFATTHSKECIESYCRVIERLEEKDIGFITLVRNKEKAVKAIVRDYDVFTDSIHDAREVRGW